MAQLADEDRIDLDASIATYLPDEARLWAGVMRGEGPTPESRAARCGSRTDSTTVRATFSYAKSRAGAVSCSCLTWSSNGGSDPR
jgi:hypothetical protein